MTPPLFLPGPVPAEMIRYAAMAPSGHNTQPWKFRVAAGRITIEPDFRAALPVVDATCRELFISLGCAAENLCLAAPRFRFAARISDRGPQGITVVLTEDNEINESPLFTRIEKRQTNRSRYTGRRIPPPVIEALRNIEAEPSVRAYFAETGTPLAARLKQYIARGNKKQMNDDAFKAELIAWMRFTPRHVRKTNDGLTYRVFGNPPLPRFLVKPVVGRFLQAEKQNRSDMKKVDSSSHLVLFTTRHNTPEEWIDLGRTLQRFLLEATGNGVAVAYMNQPCEVEELALEMQADLPVCGEFPALLLRIGYAAPRPYAPRKKPAITFDR